MPRTTVFALGMGAGLAMGAAVFAIGVGGGDAGELRAPTTREEEPAIVPTPEGPVRLKLGDLDARSLEFAGSTTSATVFTGLSSENGFTCVIVAFRDELGSAATGCDPVSVAESRGQFIQVEKADGSAIGAYRSLKPVLAASVNGKPASAVGGVVSFEVAPNSVATVVVETEAGIATRKVRTGGRLQ
ncbi:MAG: hypothetical protein AB1416_01555 [Actinomycetota bacterium]